MPAATAARPAVLLRHAFLLAGVLAVILGFLGMHVLASPHVTHAPAAAGGEGSHAAEHGTTSSTGHAGHGASPAGLHPAPAADGCTEQPGAHVDCTPSPAGAALSAPQPGATLVTAWPPAAEHTGLLPRSTYSPGTPTPGDLSISRT
ncbi:hypothetical protein [Pseudarthrobacter sp. 1C304]|uniref:hypothetical protein n=1 Tax=Pseudarthrobacter sp. 1C304 TaxID=3457438 RepID=UPI003FCF2E89